MAVKYVYTLSSVGHLPLHALHSIRTLTRYVPPRDVIVFATPPVEDGDLQPFRDLGVDVREVNQVTDSFAAFNEAPRAYGEKTHLCSVGADTVVFLDCDTLVLGDITTITDGEFDFKARPGTAIQGDPGWRELFEQRGKPVLEWMPNAGVMVFKNGIHREIQSEWRRYLAADLDYEKGWVAHREQYALALAVSAYRVEKMDAREHVMEWAGERPSEGVVHHIGRTFDDQPEGVVESVGYLAGQVKRKF